MIKAILDKTSTTEYIIEKEWYWQYTCDCAEYCNDFYNAAIQLGYLEKQD